MKPTNPNWTLNIEKILQALHLEKNAPLVIMSVEQLIDVHHPKHSPNHALFIYGIVSISELVKLKKVMLEVFPGNHPVRLIQIKVEEDVSISEIHLDSLEKFEKFGPDTWLFIPPLERDTSFQEFQEIIAHLRAPNGCPWDREQTHLSLRNNLMGETYEALEALDREDVEGMQEEFGDLLLQIVLHAQIAAEAGEFRMEDIISGISRKIIRRHPHVFGGTEVDGVKGVLQNWEKLKEKERADKGAVEKGLLDGVPEVLPSLTQAQELQNRAARVGFDWPSIEPVWSKVMEELEEVRQADSPEEVEKELGDLLFAVVNLIRWYKVDSESALRGTNQKFRRRFKHIEKNARAVGRDLQSMTLNEMDEYWNEAKGFE
jgi:tetrapyrrole methylase family protein / MazG family protein